MSKWFRMQIREDDASTADIFIFDMIGDWIDEMLNEMFDEKITVTAKAFVSELGELPDSVKTLNVHVNSPGGDVFGAVAIANALREQRTAKGRAVEVSIEGLAASAASVIVQAGDPIRMGDNALIMIHNPWTRGVGESKDLRKVADELDTVRSAIIATYQWHSELSVEEIEALMDAETWLDADEAVAKGFATEKVEGLRAAALLDPRGVKILSVPEDYRERVQSLTKPAEPPVNPETLDAVVLPPGRIISEDAAEPKAVLRLCTDGGCLDLAESIIDEGLSIERAKARVKAEREKRESSEKRAAEIRALCEKSKLPQLAEGYVNGGMKVEDVRAHLTTITAELDRAEIDGSLDSDQGATPKPRIDVTAVYAQRNRLLLTAGKKE